MGDIARAVVGEPLDGLRQSVHRPKRVAADLQHEKRSKPILREASEVIAAFTKGRVSEVTTQMQVCWLRDHFPSLTQDEVASLIDIPQSLVNRYGRLQSKQREYVRSQVVSPLG
jgi:hypothetical protein